jgi:long-chain fatty acid transport protein
MSLRRIAGLAMPICFVSAAALAAGYQLNEQDATTVGMALAGVAVEHNPAVQVTNPAGIANLAGSQVQLGANLFMLDGTLTNTGTTSLLGTPIAGSTGALGATMVSPYGFATYQLSPQLTAGFALDTQVGLSTHYPDGWFGRYFALNSDLKTIDLNPNLAYKVTNAVSLGAGLVARYTKARLSHAIDLGGIGFASRIPGSIPEGQDGIARLDADDWGWGYKLGADWHITPSTELGIGFRSEVSTKISGTAKFTLSPPGAILSAVTGTLVNTGASTTIKDPATLNLSLSQIVTPELTLYADFDWVQWSVFKQLTINFTNPAQASTTLPGAWRDTWKLAAGGSYKLTPTIELRAGTAYEQSPIRDAAHRTPELPDGNRIWLSGGVGWQVLANTQVNLGYSHIFLHSSGIFSTDPTAGTLRTAITNASVDIVTADAVFRF